MYALNLRLLGATVLGTLLASSAVAVPATTQVLTPKGLRPAAGLIQVPAGGRIEHIGDELHFIAADGAVLHVASKGTSPSPNTAPPTPEETGWITYANWLNTVLIGDGAHIGSFNTTWTVPPVPAAWHNQTVFLFNALEPDSFDEIVQPVLQYGVSAAGGGQFWAVASWYINRGTTFVTTPIAVNPGRSLQAEMKIDGTGPGTFNYSCSFTNVEGTTLQVNGAKELRWATLTLEAYNITESDDYPAGSTVFSGTNIQYSNGSFPNMQWSVINDPADGLSTNINVEGSSNAMITITY